ncbi:MAG: cysteine hydrolase family protein [Acidobacteriota bacterium]
MPEKALLVIDMLNDFIRKDGALECGETARKTIPFIRRKVDEFHQNKELVVFICDSHEKNDPEFKIFPPHCIQGTEGAKIIEELPVGENDPIVYKSRYSAFYNTDLDIILKKNNIQKVYVVGVCTSICVMDTVGDLRNRDYPVFVFEDGVADFDPEAYQFFLKRMKNIYGAIII